MCPLDCIVVFPSSSLSFFESFLLRRPLRPACCCMCLATCPGLFFFFPSFNLPTLLSSAGGDFDAVVKRLLIGRDHAVYLKAFTELLVAHDSLQAETTFVAHAQPRTPSSSSSSSSSASANAAENAENAAAVASNSGNAGETSSSLSPPPLPALELPPPSPVLCLVTLRFALSANGRSGMLGLRLVPGGNPASDAGAAAVGMHSAAVGMSPPSSALSSGGSGTSGYSSGLNYPGRFMHPAMAALHAAAAQHAPQQHQHHQEQHELYAADSSNQQQPPPPQLPLYPAPNSQQQQQQQYGHLSPLQRQLQHQQQLMLQQQLLQQQQQHMQASGPTQPQNYAANGLYALLALAAAGNGNSGSGDGSSYDGASHGAGGGGVGGGLSPSALAALQSELAVASHAQSQSASNSASNTPGGGHNYSSNPSNPSGEYADNTAGSARNDSGGGGGDEQRQQQSQAAQALLTEAAAAQLQGYLQGLNSSNTISGNRSSGSGVMLAPLQQVLLHTQIVVVLSPAQ